MLEQLVEQYLRLERRAELPGQFEHRMQPGEPRLRREQGGIVETGADLRLDYAIAVHDGRGWRRFRNPQRQVGELDRVAHLEAGFVLHFLAVDRQAIAAAQ